MTRSLLALLLILAASAAGAQDRSAFTPIDFALASGDTVAAEQAEVVVPENRADPASRQIAVRFVRFKSRTAQPGPPIIYLAGGPGGAGTDAVRGERWRLVDRLREVSDVIALDQRGTGLSDAVPACESSVAFPPDSAVTRDRYVRLHRRALDECMEFWEAEGADARGYTTWESAADVEAVRLALGVERVNLLGISYGTHLALATLRRFPGSVDRLVLASAEGLDQTVKRPALTDAYFARLQVSIDADPVSAERYPDVRGLIRRVLARVRSDPPRMTVRRRDGTSYDRTLSVLDLQTATGYMIGDPERVATVLQAYAEADQGQFTFFGYFTRPSVVLYAMPTMMDLASGISPGRLALVEAEAQTALLSDALNVPMPQLAGAVAGLDLGEAFRAPVVSERPALFLSGTLDGRTYPESHLEIAAGFRNGAVVTVVNGGHGIFEDHPEIPALLADFFTGAPALARTLVAPAPSFVDP